MSENSGAPRLAVLWAGLSGYMHASLRSLVEAGADVRVFARDPGPNAPFDRESVTAGLDVETWSEAPDAARIGREMARFAPDAVLICSWNVGAYRQVARSLRGTTLRILTMDNQWLGTAKQRGGVLASRFLIRPAYDAVLLAGDTQAAFARRLGFRDDQIIWGLYTCDHSTYAAVAARRGNDLPPRTFAFVGRLAPEKGIDVLAEGYRRYRDLTDDPWPLVVAGTGPQAALLDGVEGVDRLGFVQPGDLPGVFERAGCLVLPSRFEPWGVVVHEAAAAGLPVIATHACGATTRLVLDGYNGVITDPGDPEQLARALLRVSSADDEERGRMSRASEALAGQYSPERWARNLLSRVPELRRQAGLPVDRAVTQVAGVAR